ncbi:MAG: fatty acid desaturase [Proteobacteria bacterium]|nr:fatty acid desaturase [Pseudomonadota bacterium]
MSNVRSSPFPRELVEATKLRALRRRIDGKGLRHLAAHAGLLAVTGALILTARGGAWALPLVLVHGVVLTFLFAPLHETIHYTAFRRRRLNEAAANLCGFLILLPPRYFRAFHFEHHLFTQDPARDPELIAPKPRTAAAYVLHVSGLPYWRERVATTLRHAFGRGRPLPFIPEPLRPTIEREAFRFVTLYVLLGFAAALVGWLDELAWLWLVPALVGQPALRLFLLAEHTGCPMAPEMLANSRTTLTNRYVRWLTWNMPYHAEHHAYPWLPFHALPAVHESIRGHIKVTAPGYVAANAEILRTLSKETA